MLNPITLQAAVKNIVYKQKYQKIKVTMDLQEKIKSTYIAIDQQTW